MLAAPGAIALPQNLPKITPKAKAPFRSAPKRHKLCLFIALSPPRQRDLIGTTRRVGVIGMIVIIAPAAPYFRAPPRPLGLKEQKPWLKTIVAEPASASGR